MDSDPSDHASSGARSAELRTAAVISTARGGIVARILILTSALLLSPVIVRSLGPDRYGALATVTTLAMVVGVSDLGIGSGLVARLAAARSHDDWRLASQLISSAAAMLVASGLVLAALGVASWWLVPWQDLFRSEVDAAELRRACVTFVVLFAIGLPAGLGGRILFAELRGSVAVMWTATTAVLSSTSTAVSAAFGVELAGVVASTLIPGIVVGNVVLLRCLRQERRYRLGTHAVSATTARALIRAGLLFLVVSISGVVAYELDMFVVASRLSTSDAAILAVTASVFWVARDLVRAATSQLWAAYAAAIATGDRDWVEQTLLRSTRLAGIYSLGLLVPMVLVSRPAIELLFGRELVPPWLLVVVVGTWVWQQAMNEPLAALLNGAEALGFQVVFVPVFAVANLAMSLALVGPLGIAGPVLASLVTHTTLNLVPSIWWVWSRVLPRIQATSG